MFRITDSKGFHVTFENGYCVSVQFGPCNYCDNRGQSLTNEACGEKGSDTAECAVWGEDTGRIEHKSFGGESISNRSTPAEVLKLLNWAARQKPANPDSEVE